MILRPYSIVIEALKSSDSKTKKYLKRTALVGGTLASGYGIKKGSTEYGRMRTVFIDIQNELLDKHGSAGLDLWKKYKTTKQYKIRRNQATKNILSQAAVGATIAFLLYGFYAWLKFHKIDPQNPKTKTA